MRNMSFAITTSQFRAQTKHVTRRLGWWNLKPCDHLMGIEKGQGLKKGEKVVKLGEIIVVAVRSELLLRLTENLLYGTQEMILEGFPGMDPAEFVERFCKSHKGCKPSSYVNRIEFEYFLPETRMTTDQRIEADGQGKNADPQASSDPARLSQATTETDADRLRKTFPHGVKERGRGDEPAVSAPIAAPGGGSQPVDESAERGRSLVLETSSEPPISAVPVAACPYFRGRVCDCAGRGMCL